MVYFIRQCFESSRKGIFSNCIQNKVKYLKSYTGLRDRVCFYRKQSNISYKMDMDFKDCLGIVCLQLGHFEGGKNHPFVVKPLAC